ncbi:MAG: DUF1830 domain-containing protein [Cyanobacteriota bacterium]|nr:DUF1830 domain-containing protein [Cyanobacteriota bacterium]
MFETEPQNIEKNYQKMMLCYYANNTDTLQNLRLTHWESKPFERIIFPKERILFTAMPKAYLEISTSYAGKETVSRQVPCDTLRIE